MGANNWSTPPELFLACQKAFGEYQVDVCAESWNAKCANYYDVVKNGLKQDWKPGPAWCNPPYTVMGTHVVAAWAKKAIIEYEKGVTVTMLLKADFSTKWFMEFIKPNFTVLAILIGPRVAFYDRKGEQDNSNITHAVVHLQPGVEDRVLTLWDWRNESLTLDRREVSPDVLERLKTQNRKLFDRYQEIQKKYRELRANVAIRSMENDEDD